MNKIRVSSHKATKQETDLPDLTGDDVLRLEDRAMELSLKPMSSDSQSNKGLFLNYFESRSWFQILLDVQLETVMYLITRTMTCLTESYYLGRGIEYKRIVGRETGIEYPVPIQRNSGKEL